MSETPKLKKYADGEKIKHVKRKRSQDEKRQSATVRELLRQKRTDLDLSIELKSPEPIDKNLEDSKEPKKPLSSVTLASINDTIESVVKATEVAHNHEIQSNIDASRNKGKLLEIK